MITVENYFKKLKFIKFGALTPKLQRGYHFVERATEEHTHWEFYKDKPIKEKVDEYLKELNAFLSGPEKVTVTEEDARNAAKRLIRAYVHRGDTLEELKSGMMGSHSDDYSAQIRSGKIEVRQVRRQEVDFKFPIAKIFEEVAAEKKTQDKTPKKSPTKKSVKNVKQKKQAEPKKNTKHKETKPSIVRQKTVPAKSKAEEEKVRINYDNAHPVERIPDEIKFIKRFLSLHNKYHTKERISNFIKTLKNAILEKRIRKTSKYAKEIMVIQRTLISKLKDISPNKKFTINEPYLKAFSKIVGSARVRFSVQYLKRYIGIQGKQISKDKAMALHNLIMKGLESDKVNKSDPYMERMKKVLNALKQFIQVSGKDDTLEVHEEALNGLNGVLGCLCQEEKKGDFKELGQIATTIESKKDVSEVMSVEEARNRHYELVPIRGKYLELIGELSLPTQFFVYGIGGSGKSSFVFLFTQYLATLGYKILYVAGEQFDTPTFKKLLNRLNIIGGDNYQIVAKIDTLNPADFDFVVLDSKDQLEISIDDFESLRKQYPEQSFIILSQAVKNGSFTGKERWRNAVDVMIQAENGIIRTGHDKNRCGGAGEMKIFDHPSQYLKAS